MELVGLAACPLEQRHRKTGEKGSASKGYPWPVRVERPLLCVQITWVIFLLEQVKSSTKFFFFSLQVRSLSNCLSSVEKD